MLTLEELHKIAKADLEASGLGYDLRNIFSKTLAGLSYLLFGYVDAQIDRLMPDTARGRDLERWAKIWGIHRQPASSARCKIKLKSSEPVSLRAESLWRHEDGKTYQLKSDVAFTGEQEAELICTEAGTLGRRKPLDELTVTNTVAGLYSKAQVLSCEDGFDAESDEDLRDRLLQRLRLAPQGGAVCDYVAWTTAVSGVAKAWVDPIPDGVLGKVDVTFLTEDRDRPIPSREKCEAVKRELEALAPAGAHVSVTAPLVKEIILDVALEPESFFEKAEQALREVFNSKMAPLGYLDAYRKRQEPVIKRAALFLVLSQLDGLESYDIHLPNDLRPEKKGEILLLKGLHLVR